MWKNGLQYGSLVSLLLALLMYNWKLTNHAEYQKKLEHVLEGMLSIERSSHLEAAPRVTVGFGACMDEFVNADEFFNFTHTEAPSRCFQHESINTWSELSELFICFFQGGAAAERYVASPALWNHLLERLKSASSRRRALGGNAPVMASRLAAEGCDVVLAGGMTQEMRKLLPENIEVVGPQTEIDDLHVIIEYPFGAQWGPWIAPRANRFIIHSDSNNPRLSSLDAFSESIREMESHIRKLSAQLQALPKTTLVHFEMASLSDVELLQLLVQWILPYTDSLGMNEQELPNLHSVLIYGNVSLISEPYPRVATTLDEMRQVFGVIGDRGFARHLKNSRTLSRIHVHTLAFQAIMTSKGSPWKNNFQAAVKASLIANRHVCGSSEVDIQKAKLIMDDSFSVSRGEGSGRIYLDVTNPVAIWEEDTTLMDPLYLAYRAYQLGKHQQCVDECTKILTKNPLDQAAWSLKTRALSAEVYVDDLEAGDEGLVESVMDDNSIATVARPGTSLRTPVNDDKPTSQTLRPQTASGRPLSGVVRPGSQSGSQNLERALVTPRTAHTARPFSASTGRSVRLGTASMMGSADSGDFINLARLNLPKYATIPWIAKPLCEYILYHQNDVRMALDLAARSTQAVHFNDWWWKFQLGKCYFRMGLLRDAEKQFLSALKQQEMIFPYLFLAQVYVRLDQPLSAIETYDRGLQMFPKEVRLLAGKARILEALHELGRAVKVYREVLSSDATDFEAIASIGLHHFYSDQPEVALRYYRRILQMGVQNAELYNNIGLCCFFAQQYDMTLKCFDRALCLAEDSVRGDVWYNIGEVALYLGDTSLAYQCFRLVLVHNSEHAEAYNNLGVLEMRRGKADTARVFFQTSASLGEHLFEPHYNYASLAEKMGDLQSSFVVAKKASQIYPRHADTKDLLQQLMKLFASL
ncbi:unnamed protein product [Cyprideis torosa]|uniref:Uncharacterized protein n=1 Tax=Cyprideis torosa TaxID=163714 RepID=A0A7R8W5P0_9CRUS|nr:unnamed protein product [Cyprideis torosa]CAG0881082.1 unnamed protein product [Cyprideis torosa]